LKPPRTSDPASEKPFKERRKYPRFALRIAVKLRGIKGDGGAFEELTSTAVVSAGGFSCNSLVALAEGALVEVYLVAKDERRLGSARIVRVESVSDPWFTYSVALEKPATNWFLVREFWFANRSTILGPFSRFVNYKRLGRPINPNHGDGQVTFRALWFRAMNAGQRVVESIQQVEMVRITFALLRSVERLNRSSFAVI
jgi:hypothetical protein